MHDKNTRVFIILSLRITGDDLYVSLHRSFKIRLAGTVAVSSSLVPPETLIRFHAQIC